MSLTCPKCGHDLPMFRFQHGTYPKDFKVHPPRCPTCNHPRNRGKLPRPIEAKKKET